MRKIPCNNFSSLRIFRTTRGKANFCSCSVGHKALDCSTCTYLAASLRIWKSVSFSDEEKSRARKISGSFAPDCLVAREMKNFGLFSFFFPFFSFFLKSKCVHMQYRGTPFIYYLAKKYFEMCLTNSISIFVAHGHDHFIIGQSKETLENSILTSGSRIRI